MDVRLSPEQQALRSAAAQAVDRLGPRAVGQLADAGRAGRLRVAAGEAGWWELRQAAEGGGPLASGVEPAIVAEELARGAADVAFLGPTLAAELRRLAGAPVATAPETVALAPGLGAAARMDGEAPPAAVAVDAAEATTALVLVPGPGGDRLGQLSLAAAEPAPDLTRPTAVADDAVAMSPVPGGPLSDDALVAWRALGLALVCADLVGTMRGALSLACGHVTDRHQYGVPVGSFQALQHLLADALVAIEGSHSLALHAAWAVDALPAGEALVAAATAKAYCARAARAVCETVVQAHGGIGNTWECMAHVHLRRALLSSEILGGVGDCLAVMLAHHGIGDRNLRDAHGLR